MLGVLMERNSRVFLIITCFIYLFYFSFSLLTGYFFFFVLIASVAKILIAERCNVRLFFFGKIYMWQHFKGSFFLFVTTSLIVGINFLSASAIIYSIWYVHIHASCLVQLFFLQFKNKIKKIKRSYTIYNSKSWEKMSSYN